MFNFVQISVPVYVRQQMENLAAENAALNSKLAALTKFQGLTVVDNGDGVYEVVKEVPQTGDYTDPIKFEAGMSVKTGLWYYTDDPELPMEAIADGVPAEFGDAQFFDGIPA